ncbi:MAG: DUF1573 domain-containing protein [Flavobacteriales bacterium]
MRHAILSIVALLVLPGCFLTDSGREEVSTRDINFPASGYEKLDEKDYPRIAFDRTEHDMGKLPQGKRVEMRFAFTNTGGSPLVISAVNGSCGCTVGKDWPKGPIPPGEGGEITVAFDSEGRSGVQHKSVTVVSNALPASTVLTVTGEVLGPETNQKP